MQGNCKFFNKCGGCDLLNKSYKSQNEMKTFNVIQEFKKASITTKVDNIIGMNNPYKYRNKVHLAISEDNNRRICIGFFEKNSKHVIDIDGCILHEKWVSNLILVIRKFIKDFKLKPYDNRTKNGIIRYVVARVFEDKIMVTLVVTSENFAGKDILYKELQKQFKEVSLYLNINKRTDSAVFSNIFIHKSGKKGLNVHLMGIDFLLSPNSFMQINYEIATKIYTQVIDEFLKYKCDTILDLYSGIGITSLIFAKSGAKVYSIESDKSSVLDARKMQKENNLADKIVSICGKCEDEIQILANQIDTNNLGIFIDPPRLGVEKEVLDKIIQSKAKKIVYLSCDVTTLVRDLKYLLNNSNYKIKLVQPYDMFPQTNHIEVLTILSL